MLKWRKHLLSLERGIIPVIHVNRSQFIHNNYILGNVTRYPQL